LFQKGDEEISHPSDPCTWVVHFQTFHSKMHRSSKSILSLDPPMPNSKTYTTLFIRCIEPIGYYTRKYGPLVRANVSFKMNKYKIHYEFE